MAQFRLFRDPDPRPVLLVETCDAIDSALTGFKARMESLGSEQGLLFDARQCAVLTVDWGPGGEREIREDGARLSTYALLGPTSMATLDRHVSDWIAKLVHHWPDAVPLGGTAERRMLYDIIPRAAGTTIWESTVA